MSGYYSWDSRCDASFFLELVSPTGVGLTGSFPKIAIKRIRQLSGTFLDGYFWNSASFVAAPTFLTMSEVDPTNFPGMYTYCFSQSLIGTQTVYETYFKHESEPIGFAAETHYFRIPETVSVYTNLPDSGSIHVYESEEELH